LPHGRIEIFEVPVAKIDQSDMAEAGFEVQLDMLAVAGAGGLLQLVLAVQPLVEVLTECDAAVDHEVPVAFVAGQFVVGGALRVVLGSERADPGLPALSVGVARRLVPVPVGAVVLAPQFRAARAVLPARLGVAA